MESFKNEPEVAWSSYMPTLGYALGASGGPILELGVGHFSTPFLNSYSLATERQTFSVEENRFWGEMFIDMGHLFHQVIISPYSAKDGRIEAVQKWGVVFIDSSPGGRARADLFSRFIDKSEFVVVHDFHRENEEAIRPLLRGRQYQVHDRYNPPTLIAAGPMGSI